MKHEKALKTLSKLLKTLYPTPRLEILLVIGDGEACVCHLEAILGYRQAYISQHLMALRKAGILDDRRDGRYVFYHLRNKQLLDILHMVAEIKNIELPILQPDACACPTCEALEGKLHGTGQQTLAL